MDKTELTAEIKRRAYAMRNGVVSDALRKSGAPFLVVLGVNLPQLKEIAAEYGPNAELARALIADRGMREAQLLAPLVMAADEMTREEARRWLREMEPWPETVDIMCHALLRKMPDAGELVDELAGSAESLERYAALRLSLNLPDRDRTERLARQMAEEKGAQGALSRHVLAELKE